MPQVRIDSLARLLAARPTRRAAVAGMLALAAAPPAVSACVDAGSNRSCDRDRDCCGDDVRCRNERCQCLRGRRACRERGSVRCVDRRSDPDHCGRCGRRCRSDEWCVRGRCIRYRGDGRRCVIGGFCGRGRPRCCRGFACRAGFPPAGLGICVPA